MLAHLICEASEGLRKAEATVRIVDRDGRPEFLPVDRGLLSRINGRDYLPVRVMFQDEQRQSVLVQLPDETDSGTRRVWVPVSSLLLPNGVATT